MQCCEHGIRVNAIAPGRTLSERVLARQGKRGPDDLKDDTHLLGVITPAEMARSVLYLASEDTVKTTGHILVVDSGMTAQ